MDKTKRLVSLVAMFAIAVLSIASASAFGSFISPMEVNGVDVFHSGNEVALFAGEIVPVRVTFYATENESDVRVKAWVSGEKEYTLSTERFDVIAGRSYSRLLAVKMPEKIDPSEPVVLEISIESKNSGVADQESVGLTVQRDSYAVEILDVTLNSEANAGESLALDIVLKNAGMQMAEDTFVKATISALGIESKAYFGDLSAVDQSNPDKEDAAEKRMFLNIPANAPAGIYLVEVEAYNADTSATITKAVIVTSAAADSTSVVAEPSSKKFAAGAETAYSLTLVNSGNKVRVYELVAETPSALKADFADSTIVVSAGNSETATMNVLASNEGKYSFAVNVYADGTLVKRVNFLADVSGKASTSFAGNTTVLLTVVLAIIFVVLLVVLIVLLTRKPEKAEEFGESYY